MIAINNMKILFLSIVIGLISIASWANPIEFDRFYQTGAHELCGTTANSCRHSACGIDPNLPEKVNISCAPPSPTTENACLQTPPFNFVRDSVGPRGVTLSADLKEVDLSSTQGRCQWKTSTNFTTSSFPGAGFRCINPDIESGECRSRMYISIEPFITTSCKISYQVFGSCESAELCGTEPKTCKSIIFGLNDDALRELSPGVENQRLFRLAVGHIWANFSRGLLTETDADERASAAEYSFDNIPALEKILEDERLRSAGQ